MTQNTTKSLKNTWQQDFPLFYVIDRFRLKSLTATIHCFQIRNHYHPFSRPFPRSNQPSGQAGMVWDAASLPGNFQDGEARLLAPAPPLSHSLSGRLTCATISRGAIHIPLVSRCAARRRHTINSAGTKEDVTPFSAAAASPGPR